MSKKKSSAPLRKIIVLALICFVVIVFVKQELSIREYQSQIDVLTDEIAQQQKISRELEEKEKLYSSNEYIEKIAREVLGMVSADEKVYIDENEAD